MHKRASFDTRVQPFAVSTYALAFVLASLGGTPAVGGEIDTGLNWNGTQDVTPFGCPDTTTYGQVIQIPRNQHYLTQFIFWVHTIDHNQGQMTLRGEVYHWDAQNSRATGEALWESPPFTPFLRPDDPKFYGISFEVGSRIPVTPHEQYVVFMSIDKDYAACSGPPGYYVVGVAAVPDATYKHGRFVYQNTSTGGQSQWTTAPWDTYGLDLVTQVYLHR